MKTYKNLLQYYFVRHIKSISMISSIVVWFIYQYIIYSVKGTEWTSICTGTVRFLFLLMMWMGFSYLENINKLEEDIFLLRLNNKNKYYRSRIIFIYSIGILLTFIGALIAIILRVTGFFQGEVTLSNLALYIISCILASILGASMGLLFDPAYFINRKTALSFMLLFVVLSIAKEGMVYQYKSLKYVLSILPPICELCNVIDSMEYFNISKMALAAVYVLGYSYLLILVSKVIRRMKK